MQETEQKGFATTQDAAIEAARLIEAAPGCGPVSILRLLDVPRTNWVSPYYWSVTYKDGTTNTIKMYYYRWQDWRVESPVKETFCF